MELLRRQRWLFVWGLLALALQLAWTAGHVHLHQHHSYIVAAAADTYHRAEASHAHNHALDDEHTHKHAHEHAHEHGSGGHAEPGGSEHHRDGAAHPNCDLCWAKSLASALDLPVLPAVPLRRTLRSSEGTERSTGVPAFAVPRGFKARAPPFLLS